MTDTAALQLAVGRLFLECRTTTASANVDGDTRLLAEVRPDRPIVNALNQLAKAFQLRNATTLLAEMKMSIVLDWWRHQQQLETIPVHWFGFMSVQELLQQNVHLLVPVCCFLPSQIDRKSVV